tara:strand:- start:2820 stop:3137 length:318 start_codon:yes stop_codon:yes gene_type:complete
MPKWTQQIEEELSLLIKDWLKSQNKSQSELRESLQASSSRMPALLETLKKEFSSGGIPKVAERLCEIENDWSTSKSSSQRINVDSDPFNQLDLLLEELRDDCDKE